MFTGALFTGELIGRILARFDGEAGCLIVFALMASTYLLAALLMSVSFFFTFKKDLIKKEVIDNL
jgi:hypothetical protein